MSAGFVVWFTGLSGSGKSTLAAALASVLRDRGVHVELLDGDEVRTHLSKGLGFSREDRDTNIRRIGFVAKLIARSGGCAMTAAISPYRAIRDELRAAAPHFVEVYCKASISALAERDPKGLYKKALAGEIKGFTGVDDPYEEPLAPEVLVSTDSEAKEESLAKIVARLEELGYVPRAGEQAQAAASKGLVSPHGGELSERVLQPSARAEALAKTQGRAIRLSSDELSDLALLGNGSYAPLKGFMNEKDWRKVVATLHLEIGLFWPVPITLALNEAEASTLRVGQTLALCNQAGEPVAVLEVDDVFRPDKALEARALFGSDDASQPGVAALFARGAVYVGGAVTMLDPMDDPSSPKAVRSRLHERKASKVVALETPGPWLRSHEHLSKLALSAADQLLALVRVDDDGPFDFASRKRATAHALERYYPRERTLLADGLVPGICGGARGLLLRALVAKNLGASHVVLLPEDEGVSLHAVDEVLSHTSALELGVTLLRYGEVFVSAITGELATSHTAPDSALGRVYVRRAWAVGGLERGDALPETVVRPDVVNALRGL